MNLDDSLPQEICKDCANTAELSYCFRIKCEESEKVLRSQEFYSCDKCTLNFSTEEELFNHFPNHTDYFNCETEDCESK